MNDMAATDTISKGTGDSGAEGHEMRHKRGTKQKEWRAIVGCKRMQDRLRECNDDSTRML